MPTKYCPNCNNILDISKNPPKNKSHGTQHTDKKNSIDDIPTPTTVSDLEDSDDTDSGDSLDGTDSINTEEREKEQLEKENAETDKLIEDVIDKLSKGEVVSDSMLIDVRMDQVIKHKSYQKLDKKLKAQIQSKLSTYTDKIDDSISAYYSCKNCLYSKIIDPETLIISRINGNSSNNYINLDKLKNRIHSKILPVSRNYICVNKKCPTNEKGETKEAVFFRISGSLQVWYTCKVCESYWKGQ
jgi:hypothetical protein